MKKTFIAVCMTISTLTLMSFSYQDSAQLITVAMDNISFKIKNDTGTDHCIISSFGGSVSLDASSSTQSTSMKDGDDVFMYEKGTKGAKILKVEVSLKGKILLLSDLLK